MSQSHSKEMGAVSFRPNLNDKDNGHQAESDKPERETLADSRVQQVGPSRQVRSADGYLSEENGDQGELRPRETIVKVQQTESNRLTSHSHKAEAHDDEQKLDTHHRTLGVDNCFEDIVEPRNTQQCANTDTCLKRKVQDENQELDLSESSPSVASSPPEQIDLVSESEPSNELDSVDLSINSTLCYVFQLTLKQTLWGFAFLLSGIKTPLRTLTTAERDLIARIYEAWEHAIRGEHSKACKILDSVEIVVGKYTEDETLVRLAVYKVRSLLALMGGDNDELDRLVRRCTGLNPQGALSPGRTTQIGWVYLHKALALTTHDKMYWLNRAYQMFKQHAEVLQEAKQGKQIANVCSMIFKKQQSAPAPPGHKYTKTKLGNFYEYLATHPVHSIDISSWISHLLKPTDLLV